MDKMPTQSPPRVRARITYSGGCRHSVFPGLTQTERETNDWVVVHLLASDRNCKSLASLFFFICLFVKLNTVTFVSSSPGALQSVSTTERFKSWLVMRRGRKKPLSCETVSAKSGFHPSHRNFKQSARSAATDRFKLSRMKATTRLLISEVAETPDVSCLFSRR